MNKAVWLLLPGGGLKRRAKEQSSFVWLLKQAAGLKRSQQTKQLLAETGR